MYKAKTFIQEKLHFSLRGKMATSNHFLGFSDKKFYLPTLAEFKKFLQIYRITVSPNNPVQGTEGFDCDDFSFICKGYVSIYNRNVAFKKHSWAVGIIWGNFSWVNQFHAANWVLTRHNGLYLYEPQLGSNGFKRFRDCLGNVELVLL